VRGIAIRERAIWQGTMNGSAGSWLRGTRRSAVKLNTSLNNKQIADAEKQIAELQRQPALRKQNSTNSSKPPSSDGLAGGTAPTGADGRKVGGKAGGQRGHRGAHWPLVPTENVDAIRPVLPDRCQHCGRRLPTQIEQVQTTGEPRRHQVTAAHPGARH
jgi:transposase